MIQTFYMKIDEAVIVETIVYYNHLYWYNLNYHHPKMRYEDGEPYTMNITSFVMRFKK